MSEIAWTDAILEPRAAGREAFWTGRVIGANPLIGNAAREWTAGWNQGFAELAARSGKSKLPTVALARRRLLRQHRPEDIAVWLRERPGRDQLAGSRADI